MQGAGVIVAQTKPVASKKLPARFFKIKKN